MTELAQSLREYVSKLKEENIRINELAQVLLSIRKLTSVEADPPLQPIIDSGIPQIIIQLFKNPELTIGAQVDILWIITNILSGSHNMCQYIINLDGMNLLLKSCGNSSIEIVEQAIWALGNIAGDCVQCRNLLLESNGMDIVLNVIDTFKENSSKSLSKNIYWVISNMMRGKPKPHFSQVKKALPYLIQVLKSIITYSEDKEVVVDCMWALSYASDDSSDSNLQYLTELGLPQIAVTLLSSSDIRVVMPALRTLGNLATGSDIIVDQILKQKDFLPSMVTMLSHPKTSMRKETCWLLSNITAGTKEQIKKLVEFPELIDKIIKILSEDATDVKKEALWVISNLYQGGSPDSMFIVYNKSIIAVMINSIKQLQFSPDKIFQLFLEGIVQVLTFMVNTTQPIQVQESSIILIKDTINEGLLQKANQKVQCKQLSKKIYRKLAQLAEKKLQLDDNNLQKLLQKLKIDDRKKSEDNENKEGKNVIQQNKLLFGSNKENESKDEEESDTEDDNDSDAAVSEDHQHSEESDKDKESEDNPESNAAAPNPEGN